MKLIDPSVTVLEPRDRQDAIDDLKRIEHAGRTCYMSHDKTTEESYAAFINSLIRRGHTSVLEFASFHVELVTSRDVMAELTRHRHSSFAIQSQRYVTADKEGDILFVKPEFWLSWDERGQDEKKWTASRMWSSAMEAAETYYKRLRHDNGMSAQDARKVLPNSHACIINTRANLRQWLSIFRLRCGENVYPEMRRLMLMIRDAFDEMYPELRVKEIT